MRRVWALLFVCLVASSHLAAQASPTEVQFVAGSTAKVQLSFPIPQGAVFPFTFDLSPTPGGKWLEISPAGELTANNPAADAAAETTKVQIKDNTGKLIAEYPIVARVVATRTVTLGGANSIAATRTVQASAGNLSAQPIYDGGDTLKGKGDATPDVDVTVTHKQDNQPDVVEHYSVKPTTDAEVNAAKAAGKKKTPDAGSFALEMSSSVRAGDLLQLQQGANTLNMETKKPWPLNGEETRVIVGMQAAGANSSDQAQNFFFDFYVSRPLSRNDRDDEFFNPPLRGWGNVRVASYPQAAISNQTLLQASTGFATNLGNLKLNQLAQGAEFLAGLEYRLMNTDLPFRGKSEKTLQHFSLSAIGAVGATGFFNSPTKNVPVFVTPQPTDAQYPAFQQHFPGVSSQYIGITTPDTLQFPKEWLVGLRVTTGYTSMTGEPLRTAPAMVSFSLGQNQLITSNHFQGVVGRVEGFYPLPFKQRSSVFSGIYLFGSAQMRILSHPHDLPPIVLQPAPSTVQPYDSTVTVVGVPNTRDLYRLGVGVDLVQVISQWTKASDKKTPDATTTKAAATK